MSHLTSAHPYGETERPRPGEARGLCWVHMVVAALSVKSRPEHFVLICCSVVFVCVHAPVCSHVRIHKRAKSSKQ